MTPTTKTDKGADCQYLQAVIKCNRMEKYKFHSTKKTKLINKSPLFYY